MRADLDFLKHDIVLLDGAMGTMLQKEGLPANAMPELAALTHPDLVRKIHRAYAQAGSRILCANTFGANGKKLVPAGHTVQEVVEASIRLAKEAAAETGALVALDVGPLGELLEPLGSLSFESAYELFREMVEAGVSAGADLIFLETMTDLYETKAALLAAKEASALPVFASMSFEESGRTFTGCTVPSMARTLEGLGADAIGLNCSLGPDRLLPMLAELCENTRLPVIAKPNAGMPDPLDGHYDMGPEEFVSALLPAVELGVTLLGGCCGTTPDYLSRLGKALQGRAPAARKYRSASFVCTPTRPLTVDGVRVIGERINPTGKKRLQQALLEQDLDYILELGVQEEDAGAAILDVNVGHPGVEEARLLPQVVKKLQSAVSLPLQLDSADPAALEAGLRVYNGKPVVNSVNGDPEVLDRVLPLVKKYGAAVVGLCLDKDGIPQTAEGRVAIAERILEAALSCGIPREDVWIDCLTLTVSAQQEQAAETLKAVRTVREKLGLQTVLGVSNISFGLPNRPLITQTFLAQALAHGLTLPILNPNQTEMMQAVAAHRVLSGEDKECRNYVNLFAQTDPKSAKSAPAVTNQGEMTLEDAILRGLQADAAKLAREALEKEDGISLVEGRLIPALDRVGDGYEKGTLFLPQLLSAAQAAQAVFQVVREEMDRRGEQSVKGDSLIVATVQGDIHDIGKNIVKTVLENYGYQVIDLGRDVPPETVVQAVKEHGVKLVGLSALMTTTLPAMEKTVRQLKMLPDPPGVFVGGAVVTAEYARRIGADHYAADARQSVEIARKWLG